MFEYQSAWFFLYVFQNKKTETIKGKNRNLHLQGDFTSLCVFVFLTQHFGHVLEFIFTSAINDSKNSQMYY